MNYYGELNEIKKMLETQSTQNKYRSRRYPQENYSMDNISETSNQKRGITPKEEAKTYSNKMGGENKNMQFNYNVASPSPRNYNKIGSGDQSMSNLNLTGIPDLVITPVQPPIQQINDKYRAKKVFVVLSEEDLDFEVTIYFPKKFEALRKFYCGSHEDFIKSIMKTSIWGDNSGGKTKGKFFKSGDEKYIIKEIRSGDIRMFTEFAPRYFDYLCKSFFHNFPWALAKILGAYKISIKSNGKNKISEKKYYVITENLNYGITNEKHIIRYDLKGSTRNRYTKPDDWQVNRTGQAKVLLDTNFILDNKSKPMALKNVYYKILMIWINNDSLFFSRSNIVDYSLLVIIDNEKKTVRFGIIDYIQQYDGKKMIESKFKAIIAAGDIPTIVDPNPYKVRFQEAIRKYFIGI